MKTQAVSRSILSEAVCRWTRHCPPAVAGFILFLLAALALAGTDAGVHGPSIYVLTQPVDSVRLVASSPLTVEWQSRQTTYFCSTFVNVAGEPWVIGTTAEIASRPAVINVCRSVHSIIVRNVGTRDINNLRAIRVAGTATVAASIQVTLQPGYEARIQHTGEVGVYRDDILLREYRR